MSMKNSSDTIGNRTSDLLACSVLTEVGVTMTSGSIQLSAVHMYNLLLVALLTAASSAATSAFRQLLVHNLLSRSQSVIRWFQLLLLDFLMAYSRAKERGNGGNE
jgi:hypothetical protein